MSNAEMTWRWIHLFFKCSFYLILFYYLFIFSNIMYVILDFSLVILPMCDTVTVTNSLSSFNNSTLWVSYLCTPLLTFFMLEISNLLRIALQVLQLTDMSYDISQRLKALHCQPQQSFALPLQFSKIPVTVYVNVVFSFPQSLITLLWALMASKRSANLF